MLHNVSWELTVLVTVCAIFMTFVIPVDFLFALNLLPLCSNYTTIACIYACCVHSPKLVYLSLLLSFFLSIVL